MLHRYLKQSIKKKLNITGIIQQRVYERWLKTKAKFYIIFTDHRAHIVGHIY